MLKAARNDLWRKDSFEASKLTFEFPLSQPYLDGRAYGAAIIKRAQRLVSDYTTKPSASSPRYGDIAYHLLAFRYGYNNARRARKPKEPQIGNIYQDVFEDDDMLGKYSGKDLRTNKVMITMGREAFGRAYSFENPVDRYEYVGGIIAAMEESGVEYNEPSEADLRAAKATRRTNTTSTNRYEGTSPVWDSARKLYVVPNPYFVSPTDRQISPMNAPPPPSVDTFGPQFAGFVPVWNPEINKYMLLDGGAGAASSVVVKEGKFDESELSDSLSLASTDEDPFSPQYPQQGSPGFAPASPENNDDEEEEIPPPPPVPPEYYGYEYVWNPYIKKYMLLAKQGFSYGAMYTSKEKKPKSSALAQRGSPAFAPASPEATSPTLTYSQQGSPGFAPASPEGDDEDEDIPPPPPLDPGSVGYTQVWNPITKSYMLMAEGGQTYGSWPPKKRTTRTKSPPTQPNKVAVWNSYLNQYVFMEKPKTGRPPVPEFGRIEAQITDGAMIGKKFVAMRDMHKHVEHKPVKVSRRELFESQFDRAKYDEFIYYFTQNDDVTFVPFQSDFIDSYNSTVPAAQRQKVTYFDFAVAEAKQEQEENSEYFEEIARTLIKWQNVEGFEKLRNHKAAFVHGYGAGEAYNIALNSVFQQIEQAKAYARETQLERTGDYDDDDAAAIDDSGDISTALEYISKEKAEMVFKAGFIAVINRYFSTWKTNTVGTVKNSDLLNDTLEEGVPRLLEKLNTNKIVRDLYFLWKGDSETVPEENPDFGAFSYFINAGILAGLGFLTTFVSNGLSRSDMFDRFKYHLVSPMFITFMGGWLYCTSAPGPRQLTTHVQDMKASRKFVEAQRLRVRDAQSSAASSSSAPIASGEVVLSEEALDLPISERNADQLLRALDGGYDFYEYARKKQNTALDLTARFVKELLGVDPQTNTIPSSATPVHQLTWQARALQTVFAMPLTCRLMMKNGSSGKYMVSMGFSEVLQQKAAPEREFFAAIMEFGNSFNEDTFKRLERMPVPSNFSSFSWPERQIDGKYTVAAYADLVDDIVYEWLGQCQAFFERDPTYGVLSMCQKLWTEDSGAVEPPSDELLMIAETAYRRKIKELYETHARRQKFMTETIYSIEVPYTEQEYLMVTEIIASLYHISNNLTADREELLTTVRSEFLAGVDTDEFGVKIDKMMNLLWSQRQESAAKMPWLTEDAMVQIENDRDSIVLDEYDDYDDYTELPKLAFERENLSNFVGSQLASSSKNRKNNIVKFLNIAYLVELYTELNIFVVDMATRNWADVITVGDIHANKASLLRSETGVAIYNALIRSLIQVDVVSGIDFSKIPKEVEDDDAEQEEFDVPLMRRQQSVAPRARPEIRQDEAEEPALKQRTQAEVEEPAQLFSSADLSRFRGKLYALAVESTTVDERQVLLGPDHDSFSEGKNAGESLARSLAMFVKENYPEGKHASKYEDVRAYAIAQISGIYNEHATEETIGDQLWEMDFTNNISTQHEVDIVRRLLRITQPVADAIFNHHSKREVYMRGFIVGYEAVAQTMIDIFSSETVAVSEGGGRKAPLVGAHYSHSSHRAYVMKKNRV